VPQLLLSTFKKTQVPLQQVSLPSGVEVAQTVPQLPQLEASLLVSTQVPLQHSDPPEQLTPLVPQAQVPLWQVPAPPLQEAPSCVLSAPQTPPEHTVQSGQLTGVPVHTPLWQV
jgi:hypothetical protein